MDRKEITTVEYELEGLEGLGNLTPAEANFVYNMEVLGLPMRVAAKMADLSPHMAIKPHVQQARELLRKQIRGPLQLSREDIMCGILGAIDRARIISEPSTEISGYKELNAMLGYNKVNVDVTINHRESISAAQQITRQMSDAELVALLGAAPVVDAEFYEVKKEKP